MLQNEVNETTYLRNDRVAVAGGLEFWSLMSCMSIIWLAPCFFIVWQKIYSTIRTCIRVDADAYKGETSPGYFDSNRD